MSKTKSYSELSKLGTYAERFEYLRLDGNVGFETFGLERYLNQQFYQSKEWRQLRHRIIIREDGYDMGSSDVELTNTVLIHHINPLTRDDVRNRTDALLDPENLIAVSFVTHNGIHYGTEPPRRPYTERAPGDTQLWQPISRRNHG